MKRTSFISAAVALLFPFFVSAVDPQGAIGLKINADSLRKFMSVLTSDSLQGRETGQPGQKKAARYIADQFLRFGLIPLGKNGFQQHPLSARSNKDKNLVLGDKKLVYRKDFYSFSSNDDSLLRSTGILLVDKSRLSGQSKKPEIFPVVNNEQVVLVYDSKQITQGKKIAETPSTFSLEDQLAELKEWIRPLVHGTVHPAAVVITMKDVNSWSEYLTSADGGHGILANYIRTLPFRVYWVSATVISDLCGSPRRSSSRMFRRLHCSLLDSVSLLPSITHPERLMGENVPFLLKGDSKPDEAVALTAHYDHLGIHHDTLFYGADDDASGTSAVLELARVFSLAAADGIRPTRSILFMPVSGEEKGLLGSRHYSEHPLIPLNNTIADVNIDMIGRLDPEHDSLGIHNYIYVIGSDKLSSELHSINETANETYVRLKLDYRYNVPGEPNRFYFRSDHYNFARHGIPSIFYFNGKHPDYHRPTDTMDKIDFDAMTLRTRLVFHTVWELADRAERIKVDRTNDMETKYPKKSINNIKKQ